MEDIKKKLIERLKKLREEEKEKREKIQESKLEGGDNIDNQDYQFNLETLVKISKEKSDLQQRLEKIEKEEQIEKEIEERRIKGRTGKRLVYVPLVGRHFELLVSSDNNDWRKIKIKIVPLYEEIENNGDEFSVTLDSPVVKMLEKMIERFLFELERKIEKIVNSENDVKVIVDSIVNLKEWVAVNNHQKFIKKIRDLSDKNKILKEFEEFLKQAEVDNKKIFEAIEDWQFSVNVQGKEIRYKIVSVN